MTSRDNAASQPKLAAGLGYISPPNSSQKAIDLARSLLILWSWRLPNKEKECPKVIQDVEIILFKEKDRIQTKTS